MELQDCFARGKFTSVGLCEAFLGRIAEVDHAGPRLRSVLELNPDALTIADALDRERRVGKLRSRLHGVPILIKDSIDTADAMMTTAGSLAIVGNFAQRDAFLVQQLRSAGAVILGKTNMSVLEMAQLKGDFSEPEYLHAKAECLRLSRTDGIDKVMGEHRLHALIAPTDGIPAWIIDPVCGDRIQGGCSSPPAMAGYPHITVPAGTIYGLPVALSFFAQAYQEGKLIGYAYAFEQATRVRRPRAFKATIGG